MKLPTINNRMSAMDARTVPIPDKQRAEHCDAKHNTWSTAVRKRAGYQCERCGRRDVRLFADHIKEVVDNGDRYNLSNGQCLCGSCHTNKTNNERMKRASQSLR